MDQRESRRHDAELSISKNFKEANVEIIRPLIVRKVECSCLEEAQPTSDDIKTLEVSKSIQKYPEKKERKKEEVSRSIKEN